MDIKVICPNCGKLKSLFSDKVCKDCADKSMKFDADKPRWELLPFDAVEKIVEIMTYGAKKYAPDNWRGVEIERYEGALMRHFTAHKSGEDYDDESRFLHLAHMACNALFMLWLKMNEPTKPKPSLKDWEDEVLK